MRMASFGHLDDGGRRRVRAEEIDRPAFQQAEVGDHSGADEVLLPFDASDQYAIGRARFRRHEQRAQPIHLLDDDLCRQVFVSDADFAAAPRVADGHQRRRNDLQINLQKRSLARQQLVDHLRRVLGIAAPKRGAETLPHRRQMFRQII